MLHSFSGAAARGAWAKGRVTAVIRYGRAAGPLTWDSRSLAVHLGPRAFSVGGRDSSPDRFVGIRIPIHAPISSFVRYNLFEADRATLQRLGPRPFSIKGVNSFGFSFVCRFQLRKQILPSLSTNGWCADEVTFRCMRSNSNFLNLGSSNRGQALPVATIAYVFILGCISALRKFRSVRC